MENYALGRKLALLSVFLIALAWSTVVLASSYTLSLSFLYNLPGAVRSFDGQNIAFEAFAKSTPFVHAVNENYFVSLYRYNNFFNKEEIGKVELLRDAWGKAEWSNVGPGNYYIYLQKDNDGTTLKDDKAKLYNY